MKNCVYMDKIRGMDHSRVGTGEAAEQVTKDALQRAQQDVG
jgi:hypothetical protein